MSETVVSERPTFAQAFASEAPAADPLPAQTSTETATPASASADARVPPATATPETDHPSTDGPIPLERHKAILDGVYKERDDAKQQLEGWKAYEWAKKVPQAEFESMVQWYAKANQDPIEFVLGRLDELSSDPQHAAAMRSHAARLLRAARTSPETAAPDLKPDIPVYDDKGALVSQTYSADRVQSIVQHAVAQAIAEHVQPLKQDAASRKQAEQQAELQREQDAYVTRESSRIKATVQKLPKAQEHWDAIVAKAKTYDAELPVGEALRDAYLEVVLPTLTQAAKADVLDNLKTKAAASSVNPSAAAVTGTKRPASFHDPSLKW